MVKKWAKGCVIQYITLIDKCLIATYSVFLVLKKARRKQREEERENVCKDWLY